MKKIISISIKDNFLKVFTDEILFKKGQKDYSRTCIVFPGKRPFLYLRKQLADRIGPAFYPPAMFTIDEFVHTITKKEFPGMNLISQLDGVWTLYRIILKNELLSTITGPGKNQDNDFFDLYPWVGKIYGFINNADMHDIDDKVLKNIQDNAEIGYNIPKPVNELFTGIVSIRRLLHESMEAGQFFNKGYSYLKAKEIIQKIHLEEFDTVYFTGLFGLTGTEKKIIKRLMENDKARLVWHGHPDDWGILKELLIYFNEEMEVIQKDAQSIQKVSDKTDSPYGRADSSKIMIHSAYDFHSESRQVFSILKKENKIKDTVIVVPLNDTLFPLLSFAVDRLITEKKIDKFNISLDYSLARTSLFSLIKNLIECRISSRKKNNEFFYYTESYINFLNNPFIKNITADHVPLREILKIIQNNLNDSRSPLYNKIYMGLEEIEASLDKSYRTIIKEIHFLFFEKPASACSLAEISDCMEQGLDFILDKTDIRSYILSGEIFNFLFEKMLDLKQSIFACEKFSGPDDSLKLWGFFLNLLEGYSINFNTVPLQDLEIIGMLETRALNFRNVFILDVQEGIIPVEKKIDPLIPAGLLKETGMPPPEFEEELYEYYFFRLIENARQVHLFYRETPELDRSRYIEHLIWEQERLEKKLNVKKIDRIKFKINLMPEAGENYIEKNRLIMDKVRAMAFSSSVLDDYLACPVKFYYADILNLTIPQVPGADIDAMERGKIIHNILKSLFDKFKGERIGKGRYTEIKNEFGEIFEFYFKNTPLTGEFYLFKKMAALKLEQFLEEHVKDTPFEFKVLETEWPLQAEYKFDKNVINIKGRIDRVDMLFYEGCPEYLIIDYKTGNYSSKFKYEEKIAGENDVEKIREYIKTFQLPVYIYLYLEKNKNINLDRIDAELIYLGNSKNDFLFRSRANIKKEMSKKELYDYYHALLKAVLADLFDENKPFIKYRDVRCDFCEFNSLCKFK